MEAAWGAIAIRLEAIGIVGWRPSLEAIASRLEAYSRLEAIAGRLEAIIAIASMSEVIARSKVGAHR